jgi:hypothetical protein
MKCTWNQEKAHRNLRIHGVSFDMAAKIFDDPNHVVTENYFIEQEGEQLSGYWYKRRAGSAASRIRGPQWSGRGDHPHYFGQKGNRL